MLNLYLGRVANGILLNDVFFDYNLCESDNNYVDETMKRIIKSIDKVECVGNKSIYSKFMHDGKNKVAISMTELSTGCKTVLNVYKNKDKCFYVGECGENALIELLNLDEGNAFIDYFFFVVSILKKPVKLIYNNNAVIVNNRKMLLSKLYEVF